MTKFILTAAIVAAVGLPSIASAQSAAATGLIVCHPAKTGETPNATMKGTEMSCRPVNMAHVKTAMDAMHTMMMEHKLTPAEMKAMDKPMQEIYGEFNLPPTPGYYPFDESW